MNETQWYYSDAGRASGPHTGDHLRTLLASGALTPDSLVWNPGLPGWRAARDVPQLMPTAAYASGAGVYPAVPPMALPAPAGAPLPRAQYATPTGRSSHSAAVNAFVVSVLAVLIPCIGPLLGIVGVIMGASAISSMNRNQNQEGRGLATTALVLSILAVLLHGTCLGIGFPTRWYYHTMRHW